MTMMDLSTAVAPILIDEFGISRHVAIILDGNGACAAARGLPREEGHRRGVEALRRRFGDLLAKTGS